MDQEQPGLDGQDLIKIKVSKVLPDKKWKVLRLITRVKEFPKNMPNVKECSVLEKNSKGAITCWSVEIDKIPFSWKEKDEFDFQNFTIKFRAIDGDLEVFEGMWTLKDHASGGTEVTIEARIKIGIPMIERIIGRAIAEKFRKNFELMLYAFEETLTTQRYKKIRDRARSDLKGFAVIGHPYNYQHLVRYLKYFKPDLKVPSQELLTKIFDMTPAYCSYHMEHFKSKAGERGEWVCNCMSDHPRHVATRYSKGARKSD